MKRIVWSAFFAVMLVSAKICFADTIVIDDIASDTTWGATDAVYIVDRTITVVPDVTLTILPGVTVRMDEGISINVAGTLVAEGTAQSRIHITGKTVTTQVLVPPTDIVEGEVSTEQIVSFSVDEVITVLPKGLVFEPGSSGTLNYVDMTHATDPVEGDGAMIFIHNATLSHALTGIAVNGGTLSVSTTLFSNIVIPAKIGLSVDFSHSGNTFEDTEYPGWNFFGDGYSQDVHLVAGDGVYILSSSLSIPAGNSITIDPGVTLFLANNASVDIYGSLSANGTEAAPIIIAPLRSNMQSNIFIMSDQSISFQHVQYSLQDELFFAQTPNIHISHSTFVKSPVTGFASAISVSDTVFSDVPDDAAISFWGGSTVRAQDIMIRHADIGIEIFNESSLELSRSSIEHTYDGVQIFGASNADIRHSTIKNSEHSGIAVYNTESLASRITLSSTEISRADYGVFITYQKSDNISITRNSFHDNRVGVFVTETTPIDLSGNWWGSDTGPTTESNPEGVGDKVDGPITVAPWLRSDPVLGNDPVIIVPGITGTRLLEGGEEVWPRQLSLLLSPFDTYLNNLKLLVTGAVDPVHTIAVGDIIRGAGTSDVFEGLIRELIANGYQEGVDLFVFPYDWRLSNTVNAPLLKARIDQALLQTGKEKVDIVAHSMGGVLAKEYIAEFGKDRIDQLIFVGTPHLGAPKAYKALMYGDNMGFSYGFNILSEIRIKSISQNMSSIFELLPSEQYVAQHGPYIKDEIGDYVATDRADRWLSYGETKEFMIREGRNGALFPIAEDLHLHADTIDLSGIRTTSIVGCGTGAIASISLTRGWSFKPLGIPLVNDIDIGYAIGDGTVPVASAKLNASDSQYFSTIGTHGSLPSIPQIREGIVALLTDRHPTVSHDFSTNGMNCVEGGTIIGIHSPVTLDIYDENGRHTGPDADGLIEEDIPGITYDIVGDKKFAFLPSGATYRVVNRAEDLGEYDTSIVHIDDNGTTSNEQYFIDIPIISMVQTAETIIDTTAVGQYVMHVDTSGDASAEHEYVSIDTPPIAQVQVHEAVPERKHTVVGSVARETTKSDDTDPFAPDHIPYDHHVDTVSAAEHDHEGVTDTIPVAITPMHRTEEHSLVTASVYAVGSKSYKLVLCAALTILLGFGIRKVFMR